MGHSKQQQLSPAAAGKTAAAVVAARRRKKKGRPSLLDLQKRSLRLEKLQELGKQNPNPNLNTGGGRRSTRRNRDPDELLPGAAGDEEEEEEEEEEGSRKEKKLHLVLRLPDCGSGGSLPESRRRRLESRDLDKAERPSSAWKATDGVQEPSDSGPTTPLPDKKLLVFILDRLQKKDTYGVFSEPVDPEELPDYHDIIKHPMDFATIRKKLEKGAYVSLEQFEDDVFLISSNAMCYNSPDTIYYRQARAIQELAKKDFDNLRQESDSSEPEQKPRRGRPPSKNTVKQKVGRPLAERATSDFSGATLANAGNNGRLSYMGLDSSQRRSDKLSTADVPRASDGLGNIENNWSNEHKLDRNEDYSGSVIKGYGKFGKKPPVIDESRRNTYQPQQSSSVHEFPALTSLGGVRKLLVPVGLQMPHSYSRSLARFAAQLGPIGWEIAAKQIERVLPPGTNFSRGWVGDSEAPQPLGPPLLTSSPPHSLTQTKVSMTPLCSTGASPGEPPANNFAIEEGSVGTSQSIRVLPSGTPNSSTSTVQRLESVALASQESGLLPQISRVGGGQGVEMKIHYNLHKYPAMQQTINGFNAGMNPNVPPQIAKSVASSLAPGSFSAEPTMVHANVPFNSNHRHIYNTVGSQHDVERARLSGDASLLSTSGIALPNVSQDSQGLQRGFPQHPTNGLAPPDLNVGFQLPRSPQPSNMVVDQQHPDLVLQL